jgi:CheY-like chemotaxis protein
VKILRQEIAVDVPIIAGSPASPPALCNLPDNADQVLTAAAIPFQESAVPDRLMPRLAQPRNLLSVSPRSRLRALVVEENENERELLAGLLRLNGCACHAAQDGLEALDYLASHQRPDLLLLDLGASRHHGQRTLAYVRGDSRYRGMKVFAVSGTQPDEAGIDAWFLKPLDPRHFSETIRTQIAIAAD